MKVKQIAVFLLIAIVSVFIVRQLFKILNMSIQDVKPYVYPTGKSTATIKNSWYAWITPIAKTIGAEYGIPWQAIVVHTALETTWGKSSLLRKYNNFGGVKFKGSGAPKLVNLKTGEVLNGQSVIITDAFAVWNTPYEGIKGYANFFHKNKRYAQALKFPNDPKQFIVEIKKARYATGTNYVSVLHGMLDSFSKSQYA